MRTIQHYGTDRRSRRTTGRFELLQPLLDLVTTLDPHFNLAYRFGAIFLSSDEPDGPARPDLAVALLEKGLRANPSRWQYAEDIGFVNYWHTGNYEEAAHWFDRAAEMPGAPPWLKPLAAVTVARGGDRRGARQLLGELLSANEEYVRGSAARGLRQLDTLDEIDAMQSLVDRFRSATGADVTGWEDLVRARVVPGVPLDPSGVPLQYDRGDAHGQTRPVVHPRTAAAGAQPMTPVALAVVLVPFGLIIGSFLNVCIGRLPAGESIVSPASRCPNCRTPIAWYDNIPVASYLALGGRCRVCRTSISVRYPLIEIATALVFAANGLAFGTDAVLLAVRLAFSAMLVTLFGTDLETQRLPNVITLPGIALGLIASVWCAPGLEACLIGAALGGAFSPPYGGDGKRRPAWMAWASAT